MNVCEMHIVPCSPGCHIAYEPRLEKTCLQGFQQGKTQTGLLRLRS